MFTPTAATIRVPTDASGFAAVDVTDVTALRVVSTAGVHIAFGGSQAVASDLYIPANTPEVFGVPADTTVLHVRSGGTTYVTPGTVVYPSGDVL